MEFTNCSKIDLVERIKAILESKGLTLYQVSQESRRRYGKPSPYFVPHNLYYELGLGTFSPSFPQMFALSKISCLRFHDWLRVFGFNLEDITRLQVLLSPKRTMLIDSPLGDPESWVPWFRDRVGNPAAPTSAPLGQLLEFGPPVRLRSILQTKSSFVYVKIGREDVFAFPDLLPGSIVRANMQLSKAMLSTLNREASKCLFLIEHASGLCCCRLQAVGTNRVIPLSTELPYARVELDLNHEARVLGVVDLEIRSLVEQQEPDVPSELAKCWRPLALKQEDIRLSHLLRDARLKMGLSFREASTLSRRIASQLGDEQYFVAPGSLSDYEAVDTPPRHIHKAITLCAVYGLHFSVFLKSIDLVAQHAGADPIPDNLVPRKFSIHFRRDVSETDDSNGPGFFGRLLRQSEHVPFFLGESLSHLSGLKNPSLLDFFWIEGERNPLHPLLVNGLLVIVNRQRKKPVHFRMKPLWQQPLYVLLRRDGTYMFACCSLEDGTLVIHPYSHQHQRPEHLRNHQDAEVVGQIVTIVRTLEGT